VSGDSGAQEHGRLWLWAPDFAFRESGDEWVIVANLHKVDARTRREFDFHGLSA
jgi:hypothetical protein